MKTLLLLFWEFFKTGLFSIGGGLSTIPFLEDISSRYMWFTLEDLSNIIAISESTPGPLGVNAATYCGNITYGPLGAVVATLGLITPSIIIILIIAKILEKFQNNKIVKDSFYALRPVSVGLISSSLISMCILTFYNGVGTTFIESINIKCIFLSIIMLFVTNFKYTKKLHPIVYILSSGVLGIIFSI